MTICQYANVPIRQYNNEIIRKVEKEMKAKKKNTIMKQVKAARKQSREEEIQTHGKSINYRKVMASKKQYNRKKNKADDEVLPYLFVV